MSFETASATSVADLFSKLNTFATGTPGWTANHSAADRLFLSKSPGSNAIFVAFRWDSGTPANVGIYQALGFISSGTDPGNHTNDSGSGVISGTNSVLDDERSVPLDNDTNRYWFFEDDHYIHAVVEVATGDFRHFGMGLLDKLGTWTGGEYAYGWKSDPAGGTSGIATRGPATMLLDGVATGTGMEDYSATIHAEGLPNQSGSTRWGVIWASNAGNGLDRAGNARILMPGGFRGGPVARGFGRWSSTSEKGLVPMYPIDIFYREGTNVYLMGTMKDVRGVNIEFFSGGDEIVIGSDTWVLFPSHRKQASSGSAYQGIAYRKVTT